MESLILTFVVCASSVICFAFGVKVGRGEKKGEPVLPKIVTPKKKAQMEKERVEVILENIENYDGTPEGQKDVPWR